MSRARLLAMGMRGDDLPIYRFGADRKLEDAPNYLGYKLYRERVRPALNSPVMHPVTENKWIFYRLMAGFGIPIPPTLGLYDPMFGTTWDGDPLRSADEVLDLLGRERPEDVVIKPAGGQQGYDIMILRDIDHDTGKCRTQTGQPEVLADVINGLPTRASRGYPGHVLQGVVKQHELLQTINPHTINTVRVVTLLTEGGVVVQGALLRLGRAGNMADNWEQGGIAVPVDLTTGTLGTGFLKPKHGGQSTPVHPDTGVRFEGQRLPFLAESVATCQRAAALLPGIRSIGWDVVLTDTGPVLLEANGDWDLQLFQLQTTGLLADPLFRGEVEAAGVKVPDGLPSPAASVAHVAGRGVRSVLQRVRKRLG